MSLLSDMIGEFRAFNETFREFVQAYREANEVVYLPEFDDMTELPEPGLYHPKEKDESDVLQTLDVIHSLASKDPRYGWEVFSDESAEASGTSD